MTSHESFIYLWYDATNKKYYLGKHKGTPNDTYTHSSSVWGRFSKDDIPQGVSRRVLAFGTDKEICLLEHELLKNRKTRCWNRYYNTALGDPRYVPQWGHHNHMYGKKLTKEQKEEKRQTSLRLWQIPLEEGGMKGWKPTKECIDRQRATKKRKFASGEIIPSMRGKTHSQDTIDKILASRAGFKHNKETKAEMSKKRRGSGNANYKHGLTNCPEHRKKMRAKHMEDPVKRKAYNAYMRKMRDKKAGWTEERYKELKDLYNQNLSNDEIATAMRITRQSVVSRLNFRGWISLL